MNSSSPVLEELLARCRRDHHAWINGDGSPYALPDEGSIMGALGGAFRGGRDTLERQLRSARQWQSGHGDVELVNGGVAGDLAWLVMLERATVSFSEQPEESCRWDLRVTEIFRRVGDGWERVHRHADPLVDFRPLAEVRKLVE